MKKLIILLFLFFSAFCFGAGQTYYVAAAAAGDATGSSELNAIAWATLDSTADAWWGTDRSGDTIIICDNQTSYMYFTGNRTFTTPVTIKGKTAAVSITGGATNGSLYLLNQSNVTFEDLTIVKGTSLVSAVYIRCQSTTNRSGITFDGCTFTDGVEACVKSLTDAAATASSSITFTDCAFNQSGVGHGIYFNNLGTFTFTGCTFTMSGADSGSAVFQYQLSGFTTQGTLSFTNCVFDSSAVETSNKVCISIPDHADTPALASFTMSGGSITVANTGLAIYSTCDAEAFGDVTISGVTVTSTSTANTCLGFFQTGNVLFYDNVITASNPTYAVRLSRSTDTDSTYPDSTIYNNKIKKTDGATGYGLYNYGLYRNVNVYNNIVESFSNTEQASGICVGTDTAIGSPFSGSCNVYNNIVYASGTSAVMGHAMCIGSGANSAKVYNNRIETCYQAVDAGSINIGLVIKAEYCEVYNNIIRGRRGLLIKGGSYNTVYNNEISTQGTTAVSWSDGVGDDSDNSINNIIKDNVIDGYRGTHCLYAESPPYGMWGNVFSNNNYISGSTGYSDIDGAGAGVQTTISAMETATGATGSAVGFTGSKVSTGSNNSGLRRRR